MLNGNDSGVTQENPPVSGHPVTRLQEYLTFGAGPLETIPGSPAPSVAQVPEPLAALLASVGLSDFGPALASPAVGAETAADVALLHAEDLTAPGKGVGMSVVQARRLLAAAARFDKARSQAPRMRRGCAFTHSPCRSLRTWVISHLILTHGSRFHLPRRALRRQAVGHRCRRLGNCCRTRPPQRLRRRSRQRWRRHSLRGATL